jgi:DNA polymerase-4
VTTGASIVHLNVIDFAAAVAAARDRALADRPFVVAGASAARAIVLALSPRAREEGLFIGMALAAAERRVPHLQILRPDPVAYDLVHAEMERISARYAPLVENISGGHLYLDLSGTTRLFGPPVDCAIRIRKAIRESLGIEPAVAVARNKLVAKVATRSIRPAGIAAIRAGEEASFLAPQDARLLPGVGPAVSRILTVTGLTEIGELASLSDGEALALFGPRGRILRDAALGLDDSPVVPGALSDRSIRRRLDFSEDVLESEIIHGAIVSLVEDAGLEIRGSRLGAARLRLSLIYSDGVRTDAEDRCRVPVYLDGDLLSAAQRAYAKAASRRIRIRSLCLTLSGLESSFTEPDLFTPVGPSRLERLQTAVDSARKRFGIASVTRAAALVASGSSPALPAPSALRA